MRETILVVGKDEVLLQTRMAILGRRWAVRCAEIAEVSRLVAEENCDLVILCTSLSQQDGKRVVRAVKSRRPEIPVLALEQSPGDAEVVEADAYAATTRPEEWLQVVEEMMERAKQN